MLADRTLRGCGTAWSHRVTAGCRSLPRRRYGTGDSLGRTSVARHAAMRRPIRRLDHRCQGGRHARLGQPHRPPSRAAGHARDSRRSRRAAAARRTPAIRRRTRRPSARRAPRTTPRANRRRCRPDGRVVARAANIAPMTTTEDEVGLWPGPATAPTDGPLTFEELQLAGRNRGMPLEALRYDITPTGPPLPARPLRHPGGRPGDAGGCASTASSTARSSCPSTTSGRDRASPCR